MSKVVKIDGINNKYLLKKYVTKEKENINRKNAFFFENCFDYEHQKKLLHKCYLDEKDNNECLILIRELNKKINSYSTQDKNKNRYDKNTFISLEQLLEKLVESNMKCFYCKEKICLLYENLREPTQWTLERLNNNIQHQLDNLEISCYKCNIQRRNQNYKCFQMGKQMKIIKKE